LNAKVIASAADAASPAVTRNQEAGFVELGRKFEVYRDDEAVDEAARRSYVAELVGREYQLDWQTRCCSG
jgi:hypothetical protein